MAAWRVAAEFALLVFGIGIGLLVGASAGWSSYAASFSVTDWVLAIAVLGFLLFLLFRHFDRLEEF